MFLYSDFVLNRNIFKREYRDKLKKKSILNYKLKNKIGLQLCLDSKRENNEKIKLKMEVGFSHIYVFIGSTGTEW